MTLSAYIASAMEQAHYKLLQDKSYYGEIPGFPGVWANERGLESCRKVLHEVLEEWIVLKLRDREPLPSIQGKKLSLPHLLRA